VSLTRGEKYQCIEAFVRNYGHLTAEPVPHDLPRVADTRFESCGFETLFRKPEAPSGTVLVQTRTIAPCVVARDSLYD
jgi:hypothetical protein